MKAILLFTGTGPILVLTSYRSLSNPALIEEFSSKGIKKFIAYEVSEEVVKEKYGHHYISVMNDISQIDDLRVLDYDGHHIFLNFNLSELGEPFIYEP